MKYREIFINIHNNMLMRIGTISDNTKYFERKIFNEINIKYVETHVCAVKRIT